MRVLKPESEAEVAAIVAEAAAARQTLAIEGGGSKRNLGRLVPPSDVLKMSAHSGVVSYEPEELVITVRAGTPLSEVETALAEKNQCLAFEPASWSFDPQAVPTIGGTVAAGVTGSRRVVLGGARDHLIGFRAVNGSGEIFKAGGKVVKNVTGYDLPKLAAGSFGTLFAMTELTLRTYPHAGSPLTLVAPNLDIDTGCAQLRHAAASRFEATGFCYLPRTALERLDLQLDAKFASLTLIRFEGAAESVEARAQACGAELGVGFSTIAGNEIWSKVQTLNAFEAAQVVWRLSVPPAAAVGAVSALRPEGFVADWAGGLLWIEPGDRSPSDVHAIAREFGGHAMLFRGSDEMRRGDVFQPLDPVTAQLTKRLNAAFDPLGVFNPGRMYDGI
jgi:glycolate oxidase FAD binding subunit